MNHSDIGVICTNLAIDWGPHIVVYVREYPHNSYGQKYGTVSTSNLGSWRSPIETLGIQAV